MTDRRFLVEPNQWPTSDQGTIDLTGPEHHHLSRVLRMKPGDEVHLFDGEGRGHVGVIEAIDRGRTRVRLTGHDARSVEPVLRITLAQGIPSHDKMDLIIQKTTELGISVIIPIAADRSPSRGSGATRRLTRWKRVAAEAARQSGRLAVPAVLEPIAWSRLESVLGREDRESRFLLDADSGTAGSALSPPDRGSALVAVGPEGGWSDEELGIARGLGFIRAGMGPRVLRSETAGILAVGILLYLAGDLGPPRDPTAPG